MSKSYKQYRKRLTAMRRKPHAGNGGFTIHVPSDIDFSQSTANNNEEAMMIDDSAEGAACSPSCSSRQNTSKSKKTIMSAACQNDFESLKEAYEFEMMEAGKDEHKAKGVENQIGCALVQAVTSKNSSLVASILDIMDHAAMESVSKWPLLSQYAITSDSVEIVELFIKRNVLSVEHQSVLLHHAARIGNTVILRKLLDMGGVDVNIPTNHVTPLQTAVVYGKNFCATMLLEAGANVKVTDNCGKTPLHEAAIRGNEAVVQQLLKLGADPKVMDDEGKTPWLYANLYRHKRTAKRIAKVLPNEHFITPLENGKTFLHMAVESGLTDVVSDLIALGCDPTSRDISGNTPLMAAVNGSFISISTLKYLLQNEAVRMDINAHNSVNNTTALSLALQPGVLHFHHKKIVDMLLEAGARIDEELNEDETVLMRYFMNKDKREFLLGKGVNMNKVTSNGKTVLWMACNSNIEPEELQYILERNLDIGLGQHVYGPTGTTPFIEAMKLSSAGTAKLLYFADCCLNGLAQWVKTEEGSNKLQSSSEHKELFDAIERSGDLGTPRPLWRQARLAILRALPLGSELDKKVEMLGLPPMVSRTLLWRHFRSEKELSA